MASPQGVLARQRSESDSEHGEGKLEVCQAMCLLPLMSRKRRNTLKELQMTVLIGFGLALVLALALGAVAAVGIAIFHHNTKG